MMQRQLFDVTDDDDDGSQSNRGKAPVNDEDEEKELDDEDQDWLFLPDQVEKGKELGTGNFGHTYKGKVTFASGRKADVVIKVPNGKVSYKEVRKEALALLAAGEHKNVLKLMGFVNLDRKPCLLTEHCSRGDLKMLLSKGGDFKQRHVYHNLFIDVCEGLSYLHNRNIIHRDIATRNILIRGNGTAVLSDYGLSRLLRKKGYYGNNRATTAWAWTAPESFDEPTPPFRKGVFTSSSDMYMVGVTMWEVLTDGQKPHSGIDASRGIYMIRTGKLRLEAPPSEKVTRLQMNLLESCLSHEGKERPVAKDVVRCLQEDIGSWEDTVQILTEESRAEGKQKAEDRRAGDVRGDQDDFRSRKNPERVKGKKLAHQDRKKNGGHKSRVGQQGGVRLCGGDNDDGDDHKLNGKKTEDSLYVGCISSGPVAETNNPNDTGLNRKETENSYVGCVPVEEKLHHPDARPRRPQQIHSKELNDELAAKAALKGSEKPKDRSGEYRSKNERVEIKRNRPLVAKQRVVLGGVLGKGCPGSPETKGALMFHDGMLHRWGINRRINRRLGDKLIVDAMKENYTPAVAYCYGNGWGGLEKDRRKNEEMWERAAKEGDAYGICFLGWVVESNLKETTGASESPQYAATKEAFDLFKRAADLGNIFAYVPTGNYYLYGDGGVEIDLDKAQHYFQLADDVGHRQARKGLQNVEAARLRTKPIKPTVVALQPNRGERKGKLLSRWSSSQQSPLPSKPQEPRKYIPPRASYMRREQQQPPPTRKKTGTHSIAPGERKSTPWRSRVHWNAHSGARRYKQVFERILYILEQKLAYIRSKSSSGANLSALADLRIGKEYDDNQQIQAKYLVCNNEMKIGKQHVSSLLELAPRDNPLGVCKDRTGSIRWWPMHLYSFTNVKNDLWAKMKKNLCLKYGVDISFIRLVFRGPELENPSSLHGVSIYVARLIEPYNIEISIPVEDVYAKPKLDKSKWSWRKQ
mmetsp:Transcript_34999/g.56710  ORF Transcript_34999/g.56710 Transcript_34999/m.56710 type:complete len:975 (-) Transcript_34999:244-3168(-)